MRTWKLWVVVSAVVGGCSDSNGGLPAPSGPGPDAAVDSRPPVEDAPVVGAEIGGAGGSGGATIGSGGMSGGNYAIDAGAAAIGHGGMLGTGGSDVGPQGTGGVAWPLDAGIDAARDGEGGDDVARDQAGVGETASAMDGASSTTSALDLVPRNNAVAGWRIDPSVPTTANRIAAVATTQMEAENLIDGASANFYAPPATPTMFAWQNYVNPSLPSPMGDATGSRLSLYLLQMPTPQQACDLYTSLWQSSLYVANTWAQPTSPALGTASRITDSGTDWWINFCKGSYYVEVRMSPSYGPAPDYAPSDPSQKQAAMAFATAVAARM